MKELQLLAELLNLATQKGAFDMNQVAAGLKALEQISKVVPNDEQPVAQASPPRKIKAEKAGA